MQTHYVHPDNPQPRAIAQAIKALKQDKLIVYPTETCYAFACRMGSSEALAQLRRTRGLDDNHQFTLLCRDLSEIATYAQVSNAHFKLLKSLTPAPITFILPATKDVPKKLAHPKRKTIGIRVPSGAVAQMLLEAIGEPLITSSLSLADGHVSIDDPDEIAEKLERHIDCLLHQGTLSTVNSTIVSLAEDEPVIIREGVVALTHLL